MLDLGRGLDRTQAGENVIRRFEARFRKRAAQAIEVARGQGVVAGDPQPAGVETGRPDFIDQGFQDPIGLHHVLSRHGHLVEDGNVGEQARPPVRTEKNERVCPRGPVFPIVGNEGEGGIEVGEVHDVTVAV